MKNNPSIEMNINIQENDYYKGELEYIRLVCGRGHTIYIKMVDDDWNTVVIVTADELEEQDDIVKYLNTLKTISDENTTND